MRSITPAIAILIAFSVFSCSERERLNPIDPSNPDTGGVGKEFWAIAGNNVVNLNWDFPDFSDISGFQMYKREYGGDFSPMFEDLISPNIRDIEDRKVKNGKFYQYQLGIFISGSKEISRSVIADAEPGPEVCWTTNFGTRELIKVNPDCRYILSKMYVPGILKASVNPADGSVWAINDEGKAVVRIRSDGKLDRHLGDFELIGDIAPDPMDGGCWILDHLGNELVKLSINGVRKEVLVGFRGVPLNQPTSVYLSKGVIWISDSGNGRVIRHPLGSINGQRDSVKDIPFPGLLVADESRGISWVFSEGSSRIIALDVNMDVMFNIELTSVNSMDIDSNRGNLWVSRRTHSPEEDSLIRISPNGDVDVKVKGFLLPFISLSSQDGTLWVADSTLGVIAKLSPDGKLLNSIDDLGRLIWVSVYQEG